MDALKDWLEKREATQAAEAVRIRNLYGDAVLNEIALQLYMIVEGLEDIRNEIANKN